MLAATPRRATLPLCRRIEAGRQGREVDVPHFAIFIAEDTAPASRLPMPLILLMILIYASKMRSADLSMHLLF